MVEHGPNIPHCESQKLTLYRFVPGVVGYTTTELLPVANCVPPMQPTIDGPYQKGTNRLSLLFVTLSWRKSPAHVQLDDAVSEGVGITFELQALKAQSSTHPRPEPVTQIIMRLYQAFGIVQYGKLM
jgi:hypothetical protein